MNKITYLVHTSTYIMQKTHVLINCETGAEEYVKSQITKIKDVKNVERTTGLYDLVVEMESNNEEQIKRQVGTKIKNMKSIRSTLMLVHA